MNIKRILLFCGIFIVGFIHKSAAQLSINVPLNKYGIPVVMREDTYLKQISTDPTQKMILLNVAIPDLVIDLRYASKHNFMHKRMYPANIDFTFLRLPAAKALQNIQETLKSKGFGLKIFDAYRPYSITEKFWKEIHDERYVANPSKASGHNKGISIDLTIIDLATKKELDMGTGFDNFTDSAHQSFKALPPNALQNRKLLNDVMEANGFKQLETEWWHFTFQTTTIFDAMDISFKSLKKIALK